MSAITHSGCNDYSLLGDLPDSRIDGYARRLSGKAMGRGALTFQSLRVWVSNIFSFFFGIGDQTRDANVISSSGAGMHSETIDCLARYGLIGTVLFLAALICTFRFFYKKTHNLYVKYLYVAAFLYSLFNTFTSNPYLGIYLFIFFPLISLNSKRIFYSNYCYEQVHNFC